MEEKLEKLYKECIDELEKIEGYETRGFKIDILEVKNSILVKFKDHARGLKKEILKSDAESQTLEDVICLVFLQYYFTEFTKAHDEAKLIDILQKTWRKMSEAGHQAALKLMLPEEQTALVAKALA